MRVVHLTDLHVQNRPLARELGTSKRFLGSANLYVMGRRRKFDATVQQAAVRSALAEEPDVVVITGDLTAQALDSEFEAARRLLDPLLQAVPTVMIPGNHDTYVPEQAPGGRMLRWFGEWMQGGLPYLQVVQDVAFLAIETCRSHWVLSSGLSPEGQVEEARRMLEQAPWPEPRPFVFLLLHYPLRGRDGRPYGPAGRALVNAAAIEGFLAGTRRVDAVLHGHEHHGFRTTIDTAAGPVPVLDPGATGYAFLPGKDRTAHYNVYEVDRGGLHEVLRRRYDGTTFVPEPGGAYATGR